MKIQLKYGPITPTKIYATRKALYAFENLAKLELGNLVMMKIVEPCDSEVSEWCSPCSFVRKPNGGVRSVVDLHGLNQFVMRPTYPFPTRKDILATIPKDTQIFAVFDLLKGYWQIQLDEESKHLTTFLTKFGHFW